MGDQPKQPRREPGHKKASSLNAQEDRQLEPENRDRYHTLHQRLNVTPKELVSSARGRLEQLDAIGRRLNHIRTTAEQLESQLEDLDDLIVRFGLLAWERIMMSLVRNRELRFENLVGFLLAIQLFLVGSRCSFDRRFGGNKVG